MAETLSTDSLSGTQLNNLTDIYNSFEFNVNNFPRTAMAGGDTVPFIQGLVGAVDIPTNTHPANSGAAGIAGYARTESSIPAVGVFGAALAKANNVNVWGANFIASNTHSQPFPGQTGYQGCTVHGVEVNATIVPLSGGAAPNGSARGFYASNGSVIEPNGDFNAFEAASSVESGTHWKAAFYSAPGAADVGVNLQPVETGNSKQSQAILMTGKNASGVDKTYTKYVDSSGNLHLKPPDTNSGTYIEDSSGTTRIQATTNGVQLFGSIYVNGVAIEALVPSGGWAFFTPTLGGYSSQPTTTGCRYKRYGNTVTVSYDCLLGGSSNNNFITCTLPVPSVNTGSSYVRDIPCRVRDNGSVVNGWGLIEFDDNATEFTVYKDALGSGWTSSGQKGFRASFTYECAT